MDPLAAERPIHTRTLEVEVCEARDGDWEARGGLVDLRKSGFVPVAGDLQVSGLLHHMRLRASFDSETGTLKQIAAEQPAVAFEPSSLSRGESCRDPIGRIQALEGTNVTGTWGERLNDAIAGPRGCTHILTLARLLGATLAYLLARERAQQAARHRPGERIFHRSMSFDGQQRGDGQLELVFQLSDLHFAPADEIARPMARFAEQVEIRGVARIELPDLTLRALRVAQRRRGPDDLESATWVSLQEEVSTFVGEPVARGMRRRVLERFAGVAEGTPLVAALLDLAPSVFQCMASLAEQSAARAACDPSVFFSGGQTDSCYMWRKEGALDLARERERARGPKDG